MSTFSQLSRSSTRSAEADTALHASLDTSDAATKLHTPPASDLIHSEAESVSTGLATVQVRELPADVSATVFSRSEWLILLILAGVQFTHLVDFILVMPLETVLLRELNINAAQFGWFVAAYGFAAALAGVLAAPLMDRLSRKLALLITFTGFLVGTLWCALAPNYTSIVWARALTGVFGGLLSAVTLATVGDLFADQRRGRAMGIVMWGFSLATVIGLPFALIVIEVFGHWRWSFGILVGFGVLLTGAIVVILPPLRGHMVPGQRLHFARELWLVLTQTSHIRAYLLSAALVLSTFVVIPFLPAYLVANVGRPETDLKWIYLCGGLATLATGPLIGWCSDRWSKLVVFRVLLVVNLVPLLIYTHLPPVPRWLALSITTLFMIFGSGRMVPAMSMITSAAVSQYRGSFLSINSSVQQVGIALAALIAGVLVQHREKEPIIGYPNAGYFAIVATVICFILAGQLRTPAQVRTVG